LTLSEQFGEASFFSFGLRVTYVPFMISLERGSSFGSFSATGSNLSNREGEGTLFLPIPFYLFRITNSFLPSLLAPSGGLFPISSARPRKGRGFLPVPLPLQALSYPFFPPLDFTSFPYPCMEIFTEQISLLMT